MNCAAAAKRELRSHFRRLRQSQNTAAQRSHELALAQHATAVLNKYPKARNIAVYLEFDGEIGTGHLIQLLRRRGKNVFVPIIANNDMTFASLGAAGMQQDNPLNGQQLIPNRRRISASDKPAVTGFESGLYR